MQDARVRRQLVECLVLMCGTRRGRQYLRDIKVYPVVKGLHVFIENNCRTAPVAASGAKGHETDLAIVRAGVPTHDDVLSLAPDDEATVEAIVKLVRRLVEL